MIAIVSSKSEPGAGKCVVLLNEIHQCLLLIVSVTDRTPHLLALEAFPAEWHGSNFFPGAWKADLTINSVSGSQPPKTTSPTIHGDKLVGFPFLMRSSINSWRFVRRAD